MLSDLYSAINYLLSPETLVQAARILIPFVGLGSGFYLLIIQPQRDQRRRNILVGEHLRPGVIAKTVNNLQGLVVFVTNNSVIIELATGQKVEVLKQTITAIIHEKN